MFCTILVKISIFFVILKLKPLTCHLKDMGEENVVFMKFAKQMEKRILGGEVTSLKEFPTSVQFFNLGNLCGGSILTLRAVLTAAHCFDHNTNIAEMVILSNPRFLFDRQAVSHEVWDYVCHENYNKGNYLANDIAALLIHDTFEFGTYNQKALLVNNNFWMKKDEKLIASGWGEIEYGKLDSKAKLKKAELYYVEREKCMKLNNVKIGPEMFCLFGNGVNDTCRGDSGGGVMWKGLLVGITSHGRGCGNAPGIYVNVYYMKEWIKRNVQNLVAKFCKFHEKGH